MIGRDLSHFRVLEEIGSGGMGIVYRALDLRLDRTVALKVLPPDALADPERRTRFVREARAASALNHPGIVTVHEIGSQDGVDFIAMELVDGEPLRSAIPPQGLAPEIALRLASELARALAAAHDRGVIHRDLKPENVLLTRDGHIKVLDFGLARLAPAPADLDARTDTMVTRPGAVMGTVGYMSPEQVRGERANARSDVFSLGALMYEMASGRRAFVGGSGIETLNAILNTEPPDLAASGSIARGYAAVVARCLRKDPAHRFAAAGEVARALEALGAPAVPSDRAAPRRWAAAAVSAVVLAVGGLALRDRLAPGRGPEAIRSLAVLPLQNLSGDPQQEFFTEGMTDALIEKLSRIGALRVISRTSTVRYKSERAPLSQIARELDVDAVVEGSVLWSGPRVRISAQLSHARADRTLWAQSYERDLRDVLALQRELAEAIADEVRVKLSAEERARIRGGAPVPQAAYEAFLKGRYRRAKRTEADVREAIELFKQALAVHPTYAAAYSGLSSCYTYLASVHTGHPPRELRPLAALAARKALELDDSLAEAHTALAEIQLSTWEWDAAERGLRRAIELDSSYVPARDVLGQFFISFGRVDEAVAEARSIARLDPFSQWGPAREGYALLNGRRYDAAIDAYRRAIELGPSDSQSHWFLGVALAQEGRFAEAVAAHEQALELSHRSPAHVGSLAWVFARAGRKAEAQALVEELKRDAEHRYVTPAAFVFAYTGLDDRDRAFEWLERAADEQAYLMKYVAVYPPLDPLRSDPRYAALLRRAGLAK